MRTVGRTALWADTALILVLTFVWPAVRPDSQADPVYRLLAISALAIFIAALVILLWDKACKAHRT